MAQSGHLLHAIARQTAENNAPRSAPAAPLLLEGRRRCGVATRKLRGQILPGHAQHVRQTVDHRGHLA
eukprot:6005678-Lingulodinium_polyedra.AAC.1